MNHWWVNQNQTFRQEITGGYLWSPKRKADGGRNPFYDSMRVVSPGDLVFSFCDTLIKAIGIMRSFCFEAPKPAEFGNIGPNWNLIGWRVQVEWKQLIHQVRPKNYISLLQPYLPIRYSPLRSTGDGLQSIYLTSVSAQFAAPLEAFIGPEYDVRVTEAEESTTSLDIEAKSQPLVDEWEEHLQQDIASNKRLQPTEKEALVQARRGQGLSKSRVSRIERNCRVTKVDKPTHLIASHCKPWRDSADDERLEGENGLSQTPSIDHLFDRGFISFKDNRDLLVSQVTHKESLCRMGVPVGDKVNVGGFTS